MFFLFCFVLFVLFCCMPTLAENWDEFDVHGSVHLGNVYVRLRVQLDTQYMYSLFLYILAVHVSCAICTHPQEHRLQSTAIGMCNGYGMLIHWRRYWLGHPHTFSTVKFVLKHVHTHLQKRYIHMYIRTYKST
jgi:hypothetical protein